MGILKLQNRLTGYSCDQQRSQLSVSWSMRTLTSVKKIWPLSLFKPITNDTTFYEILWSRYLWLLQEAFHSHPSIGTWSTTGTCNEWKVTIDYVTRFKYQLLYHDTAKNSRYILTCYKNSTKSFNSLALCIAKRESLVHNKLNN